MDAKAMEATMSQRDTTLTDEENDNRQVVRLGSRRSRRRLERLLELRGKLAELSGERRSHALDDALDTFGQQMAVEQAIQDEFPEVFDERFSDWMRRDAELEHEPGVLASTCGICRVIAGRGGVNLTPPEAA
jgi:hypothetical protein